LHKVQKFYKIKKMTKCHKKFLAFFLLKIFLQKNNSNSKIICIFASDKNQYIFYTK